MEKLFEAIQGEHPGCEVVDVRFMVNHFDVDDQDVDELDEALAGAVKEAELVATPVLGA